MMAVAPRNERPDGDRPEAQVLEQIARLVNTGHAVWHPSGDGAVLRFTTGEIFLLGAHSVTRLG
jgi:hypothetical protein